MLIGEAINKGKAWQKSLYENGAVAVEAEELKQFIDVALDALESKRKEVYKND